ncbi:MAG: Sua5/YciO/YrdC/YwlC family protein [Syntrophotaleaceae bacterium]
MILKLNADNPQQRLINRIVECLKQGGVIAYPTDTIYGLGCDIFNKKGIKNLPIKQRDPRKPFSFICADLSDVANYAQVSNFAFKIMKRYLPGPYTFVLEATRIVPDGY